MDVRLPVSAVALTLLMPALYEQYTSVILTHGTSSSSSKPRTIVDALKTISKLHTYDFLLL